MASSIKDCAKAVYLIFNREEPAYASGTYKGFTDMQEAGSIKEISFILQELQYHFGTEEGVIQQLVDFGIDPPAAESFFENYHYEI